MLFTENRLQWHTSITGSSGQQLTPSLCQSVSLSDMDRFACLTGRLIFLCSLLCSLTTASVGTRALTRFLLIHNTDWLYSCAPHTYKVERENAGKCVSLAMRLLLCYVVRHIDAALLGGALCQSHSTFIRVGVGGSLQNLLQTSSLDIALAFTFNRYAESNLCSCV